MTKDHDTFKKSAVVVTAGGAGDGWGSLFGMTSAGVTGGLCTPARGRGVD